MDEPWQDRPTLSRTGIFFNMKLLAAPPLLDDLFTSCSECSAKHYNSPVRRK
jgi:hypothetical protein